MTSHSLAQAAENSEKFKLAVALQTLFIALFNAHKALGFLFTETDYAVMSLLDTALKGLVIIASLNLLWRLFRMKHFPDFGRRLKDEFVEYIFTRAILVSWIVMMVDLGTGGMMANIVRLLADLPDSALPPEYYIRASAFLLTISFSLSFLFLYFKQSMTMAGNTHE